MTWSDCRHKQRSNSNTDSRFKYANQHHLDSVVLLQPIFFTSFLSKSYPCFRFYWSAAGDLDRRTCRRQRYEDPCTAYSLRGNPRQQSFPDHGTAEPRGFELVLLITQYQRLAINILYLRHLRHTFLRFTIHPLIHPLMPRSLFTILPLRLFPLVSSLSLRPGI